MRYSDNFAIVWLIRPQSFLLTYSLKLYILFNKFGFGFYEQWRLCFHAIQSYADFSFQIMIRHSDGRCPFWLITFIGFKSCHICLRMMIVFVMFKNV